VSAASEGESPLRRLAEASATDRLCRPREPASPERVSLSCEGPPRGDPSFVAGRKDVQLWDLRDREVELADLPP
jgi:hypothetical protein